jgi:catechol 2,3-dioxygenase-like lactoylglutathione lyase family enzyme
MPIKLNHTIVHARDKRESATFYSEVLGLPTAKPFGPFLEVETDNEVLLAIIETDEDIVPQHYAFLISEPEFDQIFGRIQARKLKYWADPGQKQEGRINHHFGGRGVYFQDPSGHLLEIITQPYGKAAS